VCCQFQAQVLATILGLVDTSGVTQDAEQELQCLFLFCGPRLKFGEPDQCIQGQRAGPPFHGLTEGSQRWGSPIRRARAANSGSPPTSGVGGIERFE
jgi:hypothetical protein